MTPAVRDVSGPVTTSAPAGSIDRHDRLPYAEFVHSYLKPLRPVVIAGALNAWKAFGQWTPRFFAEHYPDKDLSLNGRTYRMAEFIDLVEHPGEGQTVPYLFSLMIDESFPELLGDVSPPSPYTWPSWLEQRFLPGNTGRRLYNDRRVALFIGGRGVGAALHFDHGYHSFSFQFHGEKRFHLYSPGQTPNMYASPVHRGVSEVGEVESADLVRFPRFAQARPVEHVLKAGETMFIPGGWWHATRVLSPSVSLSVNTANASNWPAVVRELYAEMRDRRPVLAAPFAAALRVIGWVKGWKDRLVGTGNA